MKKRVLAMVVAVVAVMGIITAQTTQKKAEATTNQPATTLRACFVDKNNNGTCDNFENGTCNVGTGNGTIAPGTRGVAVNNNRGQRAAGNRLAVRRGGGGRNPGQGLRDGSGRANGGRGVNFVDVNKNGTCDRRE